MLTISGIQPYWAGNGALTAVVPANNVWLAPVADGAAMPYVAFEQVGATVEYVFGGSFILKTTFKLTTWAGTLASVDAITTVVLAQFKWAPVTAITMACYLKDILPAQESMGAYYGATTWELWEKRTNVKELIKDNHPYWIYFKDVGDHQAAALLYLAEVIWVVWEEVKEQKHNNEPRTMADEIKRWEILCIQMNTPDDQRDIGIAKIKSRWEIRRS